MYEADIIIVKCAGKVVQIVGIGAKSSGKEEAANPLAEVPSLRPLELDIWRRRHCIRREKIPIVCISMLDVPWSMPAERRMGRGDTACGEQSPTSRCWSLPALARCKSPPYTPPKADDAEPVLLSTPSSTHLTSDDQTPHCSTSDPTWTRCPPEVSRHLSRD